MEQGAEYGKNFKERRPVSTCRSIITRRTLTSNYLGCEAVSNFTFTNKEMQTLDTRQLFIKKKRE